MRGLPLIVVAATLVSGLALGIAEQGDDCLLTVRLVDAESGRTIAGVLRVQDESGEVIPLSGLLPRGRGLSDDLPIQDWFVLSEPQVVGLPRQRLTLTAFSGLETEYGERTIDLSGKAAAEVTIPVRRFFQAHEDGLWNANTHVHLQKIAREESDRYLVDVGMADGLDLVFVSYLERAVADEQYTTNQYTRGELHALGNEHVHFDHGEEHRHNFTGFEEGYGHVMLLAIPELIYPVSIGPGISKTGTDGLPLKRGIERARELGGTVIWCHNKWGLEDVPNWLAGRLHANNIFDGGTRGSYRHSFYRYLDCGIPVPFSTGTDWFIYDFSRVYVPHEGRPTPEQWLDELARGRSFITNGPLLEFSVNGQSLESHVSLDRPGTVDVRAACRGRLDFERLELIHNGQVVHQQPSREEAGHFEAAFKIAVNVAEPGWLALRTPPPASPIDPELSDPTPLNEYGRELFAHTSATFVDVAGRRIFRSGVADELVQEMESSRAFIVERGLFADDAEMRSVLEVYDEGIAALRGKIESEAAQQ